MLTLVTVIHVILCVLLILVVLLQAGKGAEVGAVFGGSNQTIFGSRGAATFLSKVTAFCAVGFMVTSLTLVVLNSRQSTKSLMDQVTPAAGQPTADKPVAAVPEAKKSGDTKPNAASTPVAPAR